MTRRELLRKIEKLETLTARLEQNCRRLEKNLASLWLSCNCISFKKDPREIELPDDLPEEVPELVPECGGEFGDYFCFPEEEPEEPEDIDICYGPEEESEEPEEEDHD